MAEIILKINKKTLKASLEGEGFVGGQCLVDADALQHALGFTTVSESPKDELTFLVGHGEINQGQG